MNSHPPETLDLVLASSSPRRRALLLSVGIAPRVIPSAVAERVRPGESARNAVLRLAREKVLDVASRVPHHAVLAADTLVLSGERILGKPHDAADARRMLDTLSGRWHEVLTGVALAAPSGRIHEGVSITRVHFAALDAAEIDSYVAGGEPFDKAGGYAIQGAAGWFVTEIRGSASNVIGLPLELARRLLRDAGLPAPRLVSRE